MDFRANVNLNPRLVELRNLLDLDNRDMQTITEKIDIRFRRNRSDLFATKGASGPDGRWAPLSPAYAKWKRRVRPGRALMQFDNKLKRSLTTKNADHVARWARVPVPKVVVGTKDIKAAYHGPKEGNPLASANVPVRDVMAHGQRDVDGYSAEVVEYFRRVKVPRVLRVLAAAMRARQARRA